MKLLWIGLAAFFSTPVFAFTINGSSALVGWHGDVLSFRVSSGSCSIPEGDLNAAIDDAILIWNSIPTTRILLTRGETVTTKAAQVLSGDGNKGPPTPVIICDPALSTTLQASSSSIPALTGLAANGLQINYGFILLNSESGRRANIANLSSDKLRIVLAHEMGHVLGLGHSANSKALMYFDATEKKTMSLSQDDMDGVTYLYPREESGGGKAFACASISNQMFKGDGDGPSGPMGGVGAFQVVAFLMISGFGTWIFKRGISIRAG